MAPDTTPHDVPQDTPPNTLGHRLQAWFLTEGAWWGVSFVFHMLLMASFMLLGVNVVPKIVGDAPSFEAAELDRPEAPKILERFEVGEISIDPGQLTTESLAMMEAPQIDATDIGGAMTMPGAVPMGGMSSLSGAVSMRAIGAGATGKGAGGMATAVGGGAQTGVGSLAGRGAGMRQALVGSFGGTKQSERAVGAALNWIARHQLANGSWSIQYKSRCKEKDSNCSGEGTTKSDPGATALALLPFLAAGQTHQVKGPYKQTIYTGLLWLMRAQNPKTGNLVNPGYNMYAHSLGTIVLCEAYGLTNDRVIGQTAQRAVNFIQTSQHEKAGGWRYKLGDEGDTSVVGWCAMALKSAQMASLEVNPAALEGVKHWLDIAARGQHKGYYCYVPLTDDGKPSTHNVNMTAVGLLLRQYAGVKPDHPMMQEGTALLMKTLPAASRRNFYYWYYATQVMHNLPGTDWDTWNRAMRRLLVESQIKEGCATGSWDPFRPTKDPWAESGGRLFITSLATLTLEVYYRYLPLYKLDDDFSIKAPETAASKPAAAPAKPADAAKKPTADAKKPADEAKKPVTETKKPAEPAKKPAADAKKPADKAK